MKFLIITFVLTFIIPNDLEAQKIAKKEKSDTPEAVIYTLNFLIKTEKYGNKNIYRYLSSKERMNGGKHITYVIDGNENYSRKQLDTLQNRYEKYDYSVGKFINGFKNGLWKYFKYNNIDSLHYKHDTLLKTEYYKKEYLLNAKIIDKDTLNIDR